MKPIAQRGIALISAIFILLVLAVLGAVAVTISTTEQIGSAQDVQSARVYQAARAGIEWGLYQLKVTIPSSCVASTTPLPIPAPTLAGITVTVTCEAFLDATGTQTVNRIRSTACTQPQVAAPVGCPNVTSPTSLYIERQLEVIL